MNKLFGEVIIEEGLISEFILLLDLDPLFLLGWEIPE
jgi:hypothetical protein